MGWDGMGRDGTGWDGMGWMDGRPAGQVDVLQPFMFYASPLRWLSLVTIGIYTPLNGSSHKAGSFYTAPIDAIISTLDVIHSRSSRLAYIHS